MSRERDGRTLRLDQFLKWQGAVDSGGEAKVRIQAGEVRLNGEVETRKRKKMMAGDVIEFNGEAIRLCLEE